MFAANSTVFVPLRETETFVETDEVNSRWVALQSEWRTTGRSHLVEKTPIHIRYLPAIRAAAHGARFILIVRDGRDVAASNIKRYGDASVGARRWIRDNLIVESEASSTDVTVIRYEDLVCHPEAVLRYLCDFASIPFEITMLDYHKKPRLWFGETEVVKGNGKAGKEHRSLRNWQINQPLFDGRGTWERLLKPEDLQVFDQGDAKRLLAVFGYTSSGVPGAYRTF
jgi:hypothetical protein